MDIINKFVAGGISAITACLILEAEGLKVPEVMQRYFEAEICAATYVQFDINSMLANDGPQPPLPRS